MLQARTKVKMETRYACIGFTISTLVALDEAVTATPADLIEALLIGYMADVIDGVNCKRGECSRALALRSTPLRLDDLKPGKP